MKDLRVAFIELEYTHNTGTNTDLPKVGTVIDTSKGQLTVSEVLSFPKFLDGGENSFLVRLRCRTSHILSTDLLEV